MAKGKAGLRPICYMVMPFRRKKVEEPRPAGAPAEIDFDALWERVYSPAIEEMGYLPMRSDFDSSSVIVKAMLERIAFADLVLADVTLGNGNVYYEVGIRHVAKETSCVLVAPSWTLPLFDINQFVSFRFPLENGDVPDGEAEAIRRLLVAKVPALVDVRTPYHELLADSKKDKARRSAFRGFAESLSGFQAQIRAVRLENEGGRRVKRLTTLLAEIDPAALRIPEVALDLVALVRDTLGWKELHSFVETLPDPTRKMSFIQEQDVLALAKLGDPHTSIALYEQLIGEQGDTPERRGLIGGRYKGLWRQARQEREARGKKSPSLEESRYLDQAIESYRRGMQIDFNGYFCASHLPLLLRARNRPEDVEKARILGYFVVAACERAQERGEGDEWLAPTLLGAAFQSGDVGKAVELAERVSREGHAAWKLQTTLDHLAESVRQTADDETRSKLAAIYEELLQLTAPWAEP